MFRPTSIRTSSRPSRFWLMTSIAFAASACGRQFDLGEITQSLDQDGSGSAAPNSRSLDGRVLLASSSDIDVVVSDAGVRPAPTTDILPIALGDVDGDGLGDWIQGDTLFYGAARPESAQLEVGGRARLAFEVGGNGTFRAAGDVNGDGLMDILFGSEQLVWIASNPTEPVRQLDVREPAARLVLGSRERLEGDVDLAAIGLPFGDRDVLLDRLADRLASDRPDSFARQETQLVPLGDVNADGLADFVSTTTVIYTRYLIDEYGLVGDQEVVRESVSYVHHGSAEVLEVGAPRARLDADVRWSSAGDIDGDGLDDVIWTAPGAFFLLAGSAAASDDELSLARASQVEGVSPPSLEGPDSLTGALGDLDADGFDDFALNAAMVVSSPTRVSSPWHLFYGGPQLLGGRSGAARASAVFETQLYSSIRSLGDWDDDGFSDLVLTHDLWLPTDEPAMVRPSSREAILLRGGPARFGGNYVIPQQRAELEPDAALIGLVPAPAGDLDGDGFADMFVKGLYATSALDLGIVYGGALPLPVVR